MTAETRKIPDTRTQKRLAAFTGCPGMLAKYPSIAVVAPSRTVVRSRIRLLKTVISSKSAAILSRTRRAFAL